MVDKIDVFACHPSAGINKNLSAIYVKFDVVDQKGSLTGATHAIVMPTPQAMVLLRLLDRLQQKFSLALPPDEEIAEKPIAEEPQAGEAPT